MKELFKEESRVSFTIGVQTRSGVEQARYSGVVRTTAHYSKSQEVLKIAQGVTIYGWTDEIADLPEREPTAQIVGSREQAIRIAVQRADEWLTEIESFMIRVDAGI